MKGNFEKLQAGLAMALLLALTSGCGLVKEPTQQVTSCESREAVAAFESTVYAITRARCTSCHGQGRPPLLASPTIRRAYTQAFSVVNFEEPEKSRIAKKMTDGHCGSACKTDGQDIISAIRDWQAREKENITRVCNTDPSLIEGPIRQDPKQDYVNTRNITFPAVSLAGIRVVESLPPAQQSADANWTRLSIPLPGNLKGRILIDAQQFTTRGEVDSGSYRFRQIRLFIDQNEPGARPIYIRDIGLSINNPRENVYTLYSTVDTAAAPTTSAQNAVLLSGRTTNPIPQDRDSGDQLVVTAAVLEGTDAVDCQNVNGFVNLVLTGGTDPVAQANSLTANCVGCHNANHPRSLSYLPLTAGETNADICRRVLQRISPARPRDSALIQIPSSGLASTGAAHPNFSGTLDFSRWLQWIESEAR